MLLDLRRVPARQMTRSYPYLRPWPEHHPDSSHFVIYRLSFAEYQCIFGTIRIFRFVSTHHCPLVLLEPQDQVVSGQVDCMCLTFCLFAVVGQPREGRSILKDTSWRHDVSYRSGLHHTVILCHGSGVPRKWRRAQNWRFSKKCLRGVVTDSVL